VVPVHKAAGNDFMWEWRSEACKRRSPTEFALFHDCMEDARRRGFRVILDRPTGEMAPGRYALDSSQILETANDSFHVGMARSSIAT
jgi:hypothetical protein